MPSTLRLMRRVVPSCASGSRCARTSPETSDARLTEDSVTEHQAVYPPE